MSADIGQHTHEQDSNTDKRRHGSSPIFSENTENCHDQEARQDEQKHRQRNKWHMRESPAAVENTKAKGNDPDCFHAPK